MNPLPSPSAVAASSAPKPRRAPRDPGLRGAPALTILEEAIHLLRFAPARVRTLYLSGTVPFVLGFLFFWADMSRNVNAEAHATEASLGVALLFLWMKAFQSAAASELHAHCSRARLEPWTFQRVRRMVYIQTVWQPTKLFVLPLAALVGLPFAAACAFYHHLAVFGDGLLPAGEARRRALAAARPWPGQNFMGLLLIASGGLFIFLNLYVLGAVLPEMVRVFTGVETAASQSGTALVFSSSFLAAALAGAHVFLFALTSAFYSVRCFRGLSMRDGRDLLRELDLAVARRRTQVAALMLAGGLFLSGGLRAEAPPPADPAPRVQSAELDHSLREVLARREFAWRMPRESTVVEAKPEGTIARFFRKISEWLSSMWERVRDWWQRVNRSRERKPEPSSEGWSLGGAAVAQPALYVLLVALVAAGAYVLFRQWQQRRRQPSQVAVAAAAVAAPVADVADEGILATQHPEDEWLRLARDLAARGEYRLAVRALFLASLAGLAARGALSIARHKSNRDYLREFERRARNHADWQQALRDSVRSLERVWYGSFPADALTYETALERHAVLAQSDSPPAVAASA